MNSVNIIVDFIKVAEKTVQKVYIENSVDYDREYIRKNSLKYEKE